MKNEFIITETKYFGKVHLKCCSNCKWNQDIHRNGSFAGCLCTAFPRSINNVLPYQLISWDKTKCTTCSFFEFYLEGSEEVENALKELVLRNIYSGNTIPYSLHPTVCSILKKYGIITVNDLVECSAWSIRQIKGIGNKYFNNILGLLDYLGLYFHGSEHKVLTIRGKIYEYE
jgi:hypothetical protein